MKKIETTLPGVILIEPRVFGDDRGFFLESYNQRSFSDIGISQLFVQDNHSYSERNVIRGLHYQIQQPQGKLVRVIMGEILDVALDLRRSSNTFGKWETFSLSGRTKTCSGCRKASLTGFASCRRQLMSYTRPRISMLPNTSAPLHGMIPR